MPLMQYPCAGWFYYQLTDTNNTHRLHSIASGDETIFDSVKSPIAGVTCGENEYDGNNKSISDNTLTERGNNDEDPYDTTRDIVFPERIDNSAGRRPFKEHSRDSQEEITDETDVRHNPHRNIIYFQGSWKRYAALFVALFGVIMVPVCLSIILYFS
jgi:hypothetical protein